MNLFIASLLLFLTTVSILNFAHGFENENSKNLLVNMNSKTDLLDMETARRKGHYYQLFPYFWGWHALTWIYWIKVKLVVFAFWAYLAYIFLAKHISEYAKQCSKNEHLYSSHYGHYRSLDNDDIEIPKSIVNHELLLLRRKRF